MSGGSYEYLCYQDFPDIVEKKRLLDLMRNRLTELGYIDAAQETESVNLIINQFEVLLNARLRRLQDVWHAVEWMDSGDWGIDQVEKEINKYRSE